MTPRTERILVLAKTYPSPSAQYCETSCIAGVNEGGEMRRIYPVPFRLLEGAQHFKKWQWIEARVRKAKNDRRVESYRIDIDTLRCLGTVSTKRQWSGRRQWLDRLPTFERFSDIEFWSAETNGSLALLKPQSIIKLEITKARNTDWTEEEKEKLSRSQQQGNLFSAPEAELQVNQLEKIPFDFYYHYQCADANELRRHKIVDWEAGALFRRCQRDYGQNWEGPFRQKLELDLGKTDLMFLMGNIHRFQDQWLIISLIYPPKHTPAPHGQAPLF